MDGVKVYTESKCRRCGKKVTQEGAEGATPAPGWSSITLTKRGNDAGWADSTRLLDDVLCPECTREVLSVTKGEA